MVTGRSWDTCQKLIRSIGKFVLKRELVPCQPHSWLYSPKTSIWTDEFVGLHQHSWMYLHILILISRIVKLFYHHSCKSCRKELVDSLWCMFNTASSCFFIVLNYFYFMIQNIPKSNKRELKVITDNMQRIKNT